MRDNGSLTEQLIKLIDEKSIDEEDLARAGLHVLDWIGCASLGANSEVGRKFAKILCVSEPKVHMPNNDGLSLFCTALFKHSYYWQEALSFNAAVGNVLEMDDVHRSSILHPGPVVIPAALAVAEMTGATMQQFLVAVIKGYESTIRIGRSIGRSHYRYFHNTSSIAAFGAAMAAGYLLKLSKQQLAWALGNVGSRTGGLWQMRNEAVNTKQFHNSEAAKSGVTAALMAKEDISGPRFILEGPQGLFNALSEDAVPEHVTSAHNKWLIYECSFKPWPACRHAHPAIDVVSALLEKYQVDVTDILAVNILTYQDALTFCDRPAPKTETEAKFSIQHAIAALIRWGSPALSHYQLSALNEPEIIDWRKKVSVSMSPEIEAQYPEHFGAKAEITMNNGEVLSCALQDTLGDPERPLSNTQLEDKAANLLNLAGTEPSKIADLCQRSWVEQADINGLISLLTNVEDEK